jgi:iron complex outermembrane receptor protein
VSLKLFKQTNFISKSNTTGELCTARKLHLAVLAALALSTPLHSLSAAEAQNEGDAIDTLPAVTVTSSASDETATGPVEGYAAKRSATATKTDTPLSETPQAVTVVSRERIVDQGAQNVQDALNYAAGVRSDAFGLDSRTDSVYIRGSFPDQYLDGLRNNFNFYTSTTRIDPYMLERIEVLRGPAAMLYGQGSTAGIVNLVSKRPLAETQREIGVQLGSFARKQIQTDLTGPLNEQGTWLYRLVAVGRESGTQVDHVDDDRVLLAPSLTWRPNDDTSLTLQMRYQKDKSGSTVQFFPWSGSVLRNPNGHIDTDTFIGEPGFDRYDSEHFSTGWLFEHRFNENWQVRQSVRFSTNEVDYRTLYADSFSNPGNSFLDPNQRIIGRYGQSTLTKVRMVTSDQHLVGDFSTGAIQHKLLVGLDALRFSQRQDSAFDSPVGLGGTIPNIDVYSPVYTGYVSPPQTEDPKTSQEQIGFYVQDQMKLDNWIVVAGLRRDVALSGAEGAKTDRSEATSGRIGLMHSTMAGRPM